MKFILTLLFLPLLCFTVKASDHLLVKKVVNYKTIENHDLTGKKTLTCEVTLELGGTYEGFTAKVSGKISGPCSELLDMTGKLYDTLLALLKRKLHAKQDVLTLDPDATDPDATEPDITIADPDILYNNTVTLPETLHTVFTVTEPIILDENPDEEITP